MTVMSPQLDMTTTRRHMVVGGDGVHLHVREWGPATCPPIVFLHGWSQSHLCWAAQTASTLRDEFRLVAVDLRGHGMSDAPPEAEQYTNSELWADDLAAVIEQLSLERPVLVGWSYGAFVICDYLRKYGQDRVGAINFVAGAVKLGDSAFGTLIGPGFLDHFADATSDDLPTAIRGMRGLVGAFSVEPLAHHEVEKLALLVHGGARQHPGKPGRPRNRLRLRPAHARGPPRRLTRPIGHDRAASDGGACRRDLPHGGGVLVRQRGTRPASGGAGTLQP